MQSFLSFSKLFLMLKLFAAEIRIAQDFKLEKKIGSGSFGEIYLATHVKTRVSTGIKERKYK